MKYRDRALAAIKASKEARRLSLAPAQTTAPRRVRQKPEIVVPEGKTLIEAIVDLQGCRCLLCGTPLQFRNPKTGLAYPTTNHYRPTFDHVVPRSYGAPNIGNRLAAHRYCNEKKSNRLPTGCEFVWLMYVNAALQIDVDCLEDFSY